MTRTEELGMRVSLTGNREAAQGIRDTASSTNQLADATKKQADAAKQAATSSSAAAQSIKQQGDAAAEAARKTREAADAQTTWAQRMASGAGGVLGGVMSLARGVGVMTALFATFNAGAYFVKAEDDAKLLLARIDGVTQSISAARAEYRSLYDDSQRLRTPLAETLQGYTRIAGAVKELGGTAKQARELNEVILATAKISGVTGQEAAAAARQFAQALGSGVLQGDELRSILENNQELARQLAKGLNVNVGELRKLGEEGKLTADVVANALLGRLPEIRTKLADVPLTTADAWLKLKGAMGQWLVAGDQVEMKAGAIASMMNSMADSIDNARVNAAKPIVISVRTVTESAGGAAFVGPNGAARSIVAQTLSIAEQQNEMARLLADRGNRFDAIGIDVAAKKVLGELEKYADSVSLGSEKIKKALAKQLAEIAPVKANLEKALASGDPEIAKNAQARLDQITALEVKAVADAQRKIAEARKSEANKGMADVKRSRDAEYNELIAHQQRLLGAVDREVKAMAAVEKEKYDGGEIEAAQYHDAVLRVEQLGYAQRRALLSTQIAATRSEIAKGNKGRLDDLQRLLGQLEAIDDRETDSVRKNVEAQRAIVRKWIDERFDAMRAFDAAMTRLTQGTADLVAEMNAGNQEREFELSLLGQTETAQLRLTEAYKANAFVRRELKVATEDYAKALATATTEEERLAAAGAFEARKKAIESAAAATRDGNIAIGEQRIALQQAQGFWEGFFRSIEGGWKGVRNFLKTQFFDWLYKELARQVSLNVNVNASGGGAGGGVMGFIGSLFGGGGGGGGGAASGGGLLGSIGSLFGFGGGGGAGGLGGMVGTGLSWLGSAVPALSGITSAISSFIPVIGPLIAIGSALAGAFKNKDGVWFDIGNDFAARAKDPAKVGNTALGKITMVGEASTAAVQPFFAQMANLASNFVDVFGEEVSARARAAIGSWSGMRQRGNGTEFEGNDAMLKALATESKDVMAEFFSRAFSVVDAEIAASISNWSGSVEELTKYVQGLIAAQAALTQQSAAIKQLVGESISLSQLKTLAKEGESLTDTLTRVVTAFSLTNAIAEMAGKDAATAFGAMGLESLKAREHLIALAGGVQSLSQQLDAYYKTFFTEEERIARERANALATVNGVFAELNLTVPLTRAEFRKLVDGLDLATDEGRRMYAQLIRIAPAFATITETVDEAIDKLTMSEAFLEGFFTDAEREAMKLADAQAAVNAEFGKLGLTVPKTREEYRALAMAQDLTTESGRRVYAMLMDMADEFVTMTPIVQAAAAAIEQVAQASASVGTALQTGRATATAAIEQLFAIIDSTGESMAVKLTRKLAAADTLLSQLVAGSSGSLADQAAIETVRELRDRMAGDLALLTTLTAQYGEFAEQLFELERWKEEQMRLAQGNAATLLLIEQSYSVRRNEILASGTAAGLSELRNQLRAWLNGLLLNEQLTTLTPQQRLDEARRQYDAALNSGDANAITGAADAYLREARDFYASGGAYAAIFAAVTAQIAARAGGFGGGLPITNPGVPPISSGSSGGTTSSSAAAAAANAAASANSANAALTQALTVIADLTGRVKNAVDAQGDATRANDNQNTQALVEAIEGRGFERVTG